MNSITYAEMAQHKPVDLLFRGAVDAKSKDKKVQFVDVVEILNDRYLGRMYALNYFAIAENTVRINELNLIAVKELANYHLAMRKNFLIPEKTVYCLPITTRFLESDEDFALLLSALKEGGYKKGSLILSFFGVSLDRLGDGAKKRYMRLRRGGYKTASSGFGEDFNSLDVFTGVKFDYLRCEAAYFDTDPTKKKLLSMLIRFCNASKMTLIMDGVNTSAQYTRFKKSGVKILTGDAVSKESEYVTNAFLKIPEPVGDKKTAYLAKLQKVLDTNERAEFAELEAKRKIALEDIRKRETDSIVPVTSRPEIEKSPYQIRLEKQRELARKCAGARLKAISMIAEERGDDVEELLYKIDEKNSDNNADINGNDGADMSVNAGNVANAKGEVRIDTDGNPYVSKRDSGVTAPVRPENDEKKKVEADFNAEAKLIDEFKNDGLIKNIEFGVHTHIDGEESVLTETDTDSSAEETGQTEETENSESLNAEQTENTESGDVKDTQEAVNDIKTDSLNADSENTENNGEAADSDGFGVELTIESPEGIPLVGSYNEKGQWTDKDGNVFDGYFDEHGKWLEYEKPDIATEGHYNEYGQWVDGDGRIYDGYFDGNGRWIDYTFTDVNGEVVDNGYFDNKLGKWIAFGYFDGRGAYHKL